MTMHRNRLLSWPRAARGLPGFARALASALAIAAVCGFSPAETQTPEDKPPAGLRVQTQGNSWSFNVGRLRAMEAAAGIKGGEYYPASEVIDGKPGPVYLPGCLNGKKKPARECATLKARLEAGRIDVFSYTHSGWHETDIAEEVAEFGFTHNKNFRVLWQAGWMVHDGLGVARNGPARDVVTIAELQAALDKARKPVEARIEAINKKFGKRVVAIVPVGDAFVKMRAMVGGGEFPGVTKQSELFNDDMPHQGRLGALLQDYCIFAALYHKSPVGLRIKLDKEITPEQNAILQKIAWDTVSRYPYAGAVADAKEPRVEIIDAHTHFYDPTRKEGVPWPGRDDKFLYRPVLPDEFVKLAGPHGVAGTVVVEASPWVEDNQWLLDLAAKERVIVGVVGRLDPASEDFEKNLRRFASNPLFRGIRISHNELKAGLKGNLVDRCKLLADLGLTLDVNGGPDMPADVALLARKLPELRIVINHAANLRIDGKEPPGAWREGMAAAARCPNVYCKVSALVEQTGRKDAPREVTYYRPVLDALWEMFKEDRLVFGSNWPVSSRPAPYGVVVGVARDYFTARGEKAAAKFFLGNSQAAYGWRRR